MRLQIVGSNMTVLSLDDGTQVLFSYEAPVAAQLACGDYVMTTQYHSQTTSKHIKRWLDGVKAAPCSQDYLDQLLKDGKP